MADIVLSTLNARYIHAAMGLRYLRANLGAYREQSVIREFTIQQRPIDIVEALLAEQPKIVGLGVYIWNIEETTEVVAILKQVAPQVLVVLGGPEVSYETEQQHSVALADYVITGWGDVSFPKLVAQLLVGETPPKKIIAGEQAPLDWLTMPYDEYTDEDLKNRLLYVEASRGCPFKCEFCLSSLDKTAWPFPLDPFLQAMDQLYQRGARHFKFVDRTFNLNVNVGCKILEFFLARMDEQLFVHFEVIPDHLPERLKAAIAQFPPGKLQFEIGIQSFNPEVQQRISRKQDDEKSAANIRWLLEHSQAHLHADLIFGLPGEDLASFAAGFNKLVAIGPHEIQLGILKRLRGTPIIRHTEAHQLRFNPLPPYNVLSTDVVDFSTMQRVVRFARYWDLLANSGRFKQTMPVLLGALPFESFLAWSDWLFATTGQTHQIALERLYDLLDTYLQARGEPSNVVRAALQADYLASGARGAPKFMADQPRPRPGTQAKLEAAGAKRQARHVDDAAAPPSAL